MKLTSEQFKLVMAAISKYCQIAQVESINTVNLSHSSLFERLLMEPNDVFEAAPPKAFSYPWVSLVKYGKDICEVHFIEAGQFIGRININQYMWYMIEKISDDEYIVGYSKNIINATEYEWTARIRKTLGNNNPYREWDIELIKI